MKKFAAFLLLILSITAADLQATHIVGGEFEMSHLSGNNYRLKLRIYFDNINGNAAAEDLNALVHIYRKTDNVFMDSVRLLKTSNNMLVPYTNPSCKVIDTTGQIETRIIEYEETVFLPASNYNDPQGYYVVWERCCRNGNITNLTLPGTQGQVFYLEFPPVAINGLPFINSSPQLFPPLSDYACLNEDFEFDFSGTDTDGDQLVYSIAVPLAGNTSTLNPIAPPLPGPYSTVNWASGV